MMNETAMTAPMSKSRNATLPATPSPNKIRPGKSGKQEAGPAKCAALFVDLIFSHRDTQDKQRHNRYKIKCKAGKERKAEIIYKKNIKITCRFDRPLYHRFLHKACNTQPTTNAKNSSMG